MINFPLYVMRDYALKFEQGDYVIIQGRKTRYVLDYVKNKSKYELYADRRLELLRDKNRPYDLYPINIIVESVYQMYVCGKKVFLDKFGKQVVWTPKKFYKVVCHKIRTVWQDDCGHYHIVSDGCNTVFKLREYNGEKYIQTVALGKIDIFYGLAETKRKDTRIKI